MTRVRGAASGVRIERLAADAVATGAPPEVERLWRSVWPDVPDARFREVLPAHARRPGFRFLEARDERGRLAGFAYGYHGGPGQWWHDRVAAAMDEEARAYWLAPGHFELVELAVEAAMRRRGVGGRLHDAVLERLPGRTAVLSTQVDNEPALALYRGRGWRIVVPELDFGSGEPYAILGKELAPDADAA